MIFLVWKLTLIRIAKSKALKDKHIIAMKIKILFLKGSKVMTATSIMVTNAGDKKTVTKICHQLCVANFSDLTLSSMIESGVHIVEVKDEIFSLFNSAKIIDEVNFLVSIIWKLNLFYESCQSQGFKDLSIPISIRIVRKHHTRERRWINESLIKGSGTLVAICNVIGSPTWNWVCSNPPLSKSCSKIILHCRQDVSFVKATYQTIFYVSIWWQWLRRHNETCPNSTSP